VVTLPLIQLEGVDAVLAGTTVLRGITWRLCPGEHWAILGGNGSGKSTLLKLIRGELAPAPPGAGRRVYAFDGDVQTTAVGIKQKIALVSPELQGRYLQQEWRLTGLQVVHSGFLSGDYVYEPPTAGQVHCAQTLIRRIGVAHLLQRNVQELSTGELRKLLIARALAGAPRVLVCDEICDGLDAASRAELLQALEEVARTGTQLLYTTHRAEELIPAITHRLVLEQGRITGSREMVHRPPPTNDGTRPRTGTATLKTPEKSSGVADSEPLIDIEHADVFLGGKRVLHDIHLTIRRGQHWAILGGNGAGKTTLLKLILGDLHPALGGRVQRWSFTSRNTLWQVKRKIGYVSPELQANYRESMTGAEVIASGFFSSIGLVRKVSRAQGRRITQLIRTLRLQELAGKNALQMSYGEVRRILLARALVHQPELLICDEPFDGLDAAARVEISRTLEQVARDGTTLVVVTHHAGDLPACTTQVAELGSGKITFQGPARAYFRRDHARANHK
jgi:molybdate transport system ATP-binding protein